VRRFKEVYHVGDWPMRVCGTCREAAKSSDLGGAREPSARLLRSARGQYRLLPLPWIGNEA
jgi:hypothetical protein